MKTQIIILAGGKGKRMNAEVPKALVPFNGKPMISYLLDAASHSGVENKPLIVVGYQKELVMDFVGDKAIYAVQTEQLGTGHAVLITEDSVANDVDNVLVLFTDQPAVRGAMIVNLIATHEKSNKNMTMATVTVPSYDDWYQVFYPGFSRIVRNENGVIERSVEFKDATDEEKKITEVNPVYFCFKRNWLYANLKKIGNQNAQGEYYLTDLVKMACMDGGVASVSISPEEALGVNSIEELQRLEKIIK